MDLNAICGAPLALVMIREADDGDDEWSILRTAIVRSGGSFALDLGPGRAPVPVPSGLEEQINETPDYLRELLDEADYYISFVVQDLGSGEAHDFVVSLGIQLPDTEKPN